MKHFPYNRHSFFLELFISPRSSIYQIVKFSAALYILSIQLLFLQGVSCPENYYLTLIFTLLLFYQWLVLKPYIFLKFIFELYYINWQVSIEQHDFLILLFVLLLPMQKPLYYSELDTNNDAWINVLVSKQSEEGLKKGV